MSERRQTPDIRKNVDRRVDDGVAQVRSVK
jgi:hypothetical protein